MAAKKKSRKKQTKSQKTVVKKMTRVKKKAKKKAVRKVVQIRGVTKTQGTKKTAPAALIVPKKRVRRRNQTTSRASSRQGLGARSGGQSEDLQGLSRVERADSESVDELLDEGNAFEAGIVTGVEDAGDADEREVHSHEVSEDDVPDEYLDRD
jgi:hypothetical protein